jgi:hypothetical protein
MRACDVLSPVGKNVDNTAPNLARSFERPRMVPIAEDSSAAPKNAVDGTRHANGEPRYAARKRPLVVGLYDEVQVIGLD